MYYYRLNTSQSRKVWEEVEREMAMAAVWNDSISSDDLDLTLFITSAT